MLPSAVALLVVKVKEEAYPSHPGLRLTDQLFHPVTYQVSEFTVIRGLRGKGITQVEAVTNSVIALSEDGSVYTWGGNSSGPLGVPGASKKSVYTVPQLVESLQGEGIIEVAIGGTHGAACSDGGDCYVWGTGQYGQLGLGDYKNRETPQLVGALQDGKVINQIAVGQRWVDEWRGRAAGVT